MKGKTRTSDQETRERLRVAALHLFAERGFSKVTVRDISSEAGANLAAVSYHFRDKLGLYDAVLSEAIATMRAIADESMHAPEGATPEEKLRHYVRTYLPRVTQPETHAWIHKLMSHEMNDPTPLADRIIDEVIMPRLRYLEALVATMLDCDRDDARVKHCVSSIQAQVLFHMRTPFRKIVQQRWSAEPPPLTVVADHIAEFSIAGIRALAKSSATPARTRRPRGSRRARSRGN
ncbi:MAG TPA: CerR family C-terminal domain-containing protein [Polyangiales bacterium]|nr:CerR family C-terminal domain-containing protein [Polyangiales bacterium]